MKATETAANPAMKIIFLIFVDKITKEQDYSRAVRCVFSIEFLLSFYPVYYFWGTKYR